MSNEIGGVDIKDSGLSRRSVLGGSAIAALTLANAGCASTRSRADAPGSRPPILDLTRPADNVTAIVKVQGDISGKLTGFWGQGHIFGILDSQMAVPMLRYQSARIGRYFRQADGSYVFRYRGMIFYQDYETGEFIDEFQNPITGKTVSVRHYQTSIGQFSYTVLGPKSTRDFVGTTGKPYGQPYVLPWIQGGDRIWVMLDERVEYQRPSDGAWRRDNAVFRYETPSDELMDPALTAASASSSFQTHIDWFTWLDMPGHPGGLMQGGAGRKFFDLDAFPAEFTEFAERRFPGSLTNPIMEG